MSIQIRRITEDDIPGYYSCLDVVSRERRYLAFLSAPPLEQTQAWIRPHIEKNHPFFIAIDNGRVVGWCDITPHERDGFSHRGMIGMGVLPDFRRMGIGSRLLRAALAHAESIGLERIELEVFASNLPAVQLYRSFGFALEGTMRDGRKLDENYDDIVVMALVTRHRPV